MPAALRVVTEDQVSAPERPDPMAFVGWLLKEIEEAAERGAARGYARAHERDRQLDAAQDLLGLPKLLTARQAAEELGKIERGKGLGVPALDKRLNQEKELPAGAPRPLTACRVGEGRARRFDRARLLAYARRGGNRG